MSIIFLPSTQTPLPRLVPLVQQRRVSKISPLTAVTFTIPASSLYSLSIIKVLHTTCYFPSSFALPTEVRRREAEGSKHYSDCRPKTYNVGGVLSLLPVPRLSNYI